MQMSLVIEIGALILGGVFVFIYVLDRLFEWSEYLNQKEKEEKQDKELSALSKHLYH